jgi:hypothetical protein
MVSLGDLAGKKRLGSPGMFCYQGKEEYKRE